MEVAIQGLKRRLVYIGVYELLAIILSALLLEWMTGAGSGHSLVLAIAASAIAILWNLVFNYGFEQWEARSQRTQRNLMARLLHALGFEGGLLIFLVPLLAWWFGISWLEAIVMDLGLLVFFMIYTFIFNWIFDLVFGLPQALQANGAKS